MMSAKNYFPSPHDHERCIDDAVRAADRVCEERGERLTPLRQRVLELVWDSHRPVGAYEVLQRLQSERGRTAPPTVYRALSFLQDQGLVHRIESLNAYVGCDHPEDAHRAHLLICRTCGDAAEIRDREFVQALDRIGQRAGFQVDRETVELQGVCPHCLD